MCTGRSRREPARCGRCRSPMSTTRPARTNTPAPKPSAPRILQDLLPVARAQLLRGSPSAWGIFIDQARAAVLSLDDAADQVSVEEYSRPEIANSIMVQYRPSRSDKADFTGQLTRTCNG